jgi:hypothetical protein
MKGRTLLALAAGLLLVVPLIVLLLSRDWAPARVEGWRLLPMLSLEERVATATFMRACWKSEQCEPPFVCFSDSRTGSRTCAGSTCVSDAHCSEGHACRSIPVDPELTGGERVALRLCSPVGERKEGEPCVRLARLRDREWAWGCGPGLVCAGSGWCGRRCEPGTEGNCPEGFSCTAGDPEGPTCLPTCEEHGCPEGRRCVRHEGGVSVCAEVHGEDCQRTPCPEGQACEVVAPMYRPGEVWMQCLQPCGREGDAECPRGRLCESGRCRSMCDADDPEDCGPDWFCLDRDDEGTGVCVRSPREPDAGLEPARDGG